MKVTVEDGRAHVNVHLREIDEIGFRYYPESKKNCPGFATIKYCGDNGSFCIFLNPGHIRSLITQMEEVIADVATINEDNLVEA